MDGPKSGFSRLRLISTGSEIKVSAEFIVPLVDHQIEVPRIVNQKIAQEINVSVQGTLTLAVKP